MSKRNNNTATRSFIISPIFRVSPSQGKLHYQTSHTSDSDKTREISWPVLINYLLGVTLTAQLRSSKQANWGQPGPRRIWFWYPWSLLVRISATTQLFAQSISDLINRQDRLHFHFYLLSNHSINDVMVLGSVDRQDLKIKISTGRERERDEPLVRPIEMTRQVVALRREVGSTKQATQRDINNNL